MLFWYLDLPWRNATYLLGEPQFHRRELVNPVNQLRPVNDSNVPPFLLIAVDIKPGGLCIFFPGVFPTPSSRKGRYEHKGGFDPNALRYRCGEIIIVRGGFITGVQACTYFPIRAAF